MAIFLGAWSWITAYSGNFESANPHLGSLVTMKASIPTWAASTVNSGNFEAANPHLSSLATLSVPISA